MEPTIKSGDLILIREVDFDDVEEGEGQNDKISIYTPDKAHQIILDNEKKEILLSDKDEKIIIHANIHFKILFIIFMILLSVRAFLVLLL